MLGIAVADFNGDGRLDAAVPLSNGGTTMGGVGVYLHLSASGYGYAGRVDYPATTDPYTIAAADLDGDGRADLITTDYRYGEVAILLNSANAPGTFAPPQILQVQDAAGAAVADLNGDGHPELLIAGRQLMLSQQLAGSAGTFGTPTVLYTSPSGSRIRAIALGDLNGDGTPDILVADDAGVTVLFVTSQNGLPTIAGTLSVYNNAQPGTYPAIAVADIDGDGRQDLVIADQGNGTMTVFLQSHASAGEFLPPASYPLSSGAGLSVVVADLDGDGRSDIVTGGPAIAAVYLQDAAHPARFLAADTYAAPIGANAVAVGDVNGDGLPDILTNNGVSGTVSGGLLRTPPGVLYQNPNKPGSFLPLENLQ